MLKDNNDNKNQKEQKTKFVLKNKDSTENYKMIAVAIILGAIIIGAFIFLGNQSTTVYLTGNITCLNIT